MEIFISHIHEDSPLAKALAAWIETTFAGRYEVFLSSDEESSRPGDRWMQELDEGPEEAKVLLVLCSPTSVTRPWISFEAGCGYIRPVPVIPICHSGLRKTDLPKPFSLFLAFDLQQEDFAENLIQFLAMHGEVGPLPEIRYDDVQAELNEAASQSETQKEVPAEPPASQESVAPSGLTELARAILNVYAHADDTRLWEGDIFQALYERYPKSEIEAALDRLRDAGLLRICAVGRRGPQYGITLEGKKKLASMEP